MPTSFALLFVAGVTPAKWVDTWKSRMHDDPIQVRLAESVEAVEAVLDGRADVALVRLPVPMDGLNAIPLYEEQPVVVVPRDHAIADLEAITSAELADENILDGQTAGTVELVATGVGIALMPHSLARLHSRKDVVARSVTDAPTTRIALVWSESNDSAAVEQFIGIVRGRTANSSRGAREDGDAPQVAPTNTRKPAKGTQKLSAAKHAAATRQSQQQARKRRRSR